MEPVGELDPQNFARVPVELDQASSSTTASVATVGTEWVEDTPKSTKSTRRVKLPGWLAGDLAEYLAEPDADSLTDAPGTRHYDGTNSDLPLFPGRKRGGWVNRAGQRGGARRTQLDWQSPVEMTSFYKNLFKPALAAAGLPERTRWHDMRHTMAALWLTAGGDIYELSEQMGHESFTTTLNFYAALIPKDDDAPHVLDARPARAKVATTADNVVDLATRRGRTA